MAQQGLFVGKVWAAVLVANVSLPLAFAQMEPDQLKLYGDFLLRHESNVELDDRPDLHRERIRLRLGADYELSDEIVVGARLRTGNPTDQNSSFQTLGNALESFTLSLDRAFVRYRPAMAPGFQLTAGKFAHPFWKNPIFGALVWDGDVQPEGAVVEYSLSDLDQGVLQKLDVRIGEYVLLESSDKDEASVFVAQVATHCRLADGLNGSLAVGFYRYANLVPDGDTYFLGVDENKGNSTVGTPPSDFRAEFRIVDAIGALTYSGWRRPLTVSGQYIFNDGADGIDDTGFAVGVAVGQAKVKGSWRAYYQYQEIEQDAVFSPFAQDDFLLRTNHRSHVAGCTYKFAEKAAVNLWALVSARDKIEPGALPTADSDASQWRIRADINIKF